MRAGPALGPLLLLLASACLESPPDASAPGDDGGGPGGDARIGEGLVLWLEMDDSLDDGIATDSTGMQLATCTGHCPTEQPAARIDGGYRFAGTASPTYLVIDDTSSLRLRTGTIAAWINLAGPGTGSIFSKSFGTGVENSIGLFYLETQGIYFEVGDRVLESGVDEIPMGEWVHVTGTWDRTAAERHLYIDGDELVGGGNFAMDFDEHPFLIGKESDNEALGASLEGELDDLRLYDRALSADEVQMLADGG